MNEKWLELRIWSEMFHDAQQQRIAAVNRAERGGVDPGVYAGFINRLEDAEHACKLELVRCYRRTVPASVRQWQKDSPGIGEHLLARLLGHLGHPVHAEPHRWEGTGADRVLVPLEGFDRTVSQLWSYCGHGDATRKRRKGMTAEEAFALGNPKCKMLVWNLAVACVKQKPGTVYRDVYDAARKEYATRDWTNGHQHAAAVRKVGKEILRDLWTAAKEPVSEVLAA